MPAERHLHIIAFDVPYPADYGGVIDIYHKIRALQQTGVRVHLHAFTYGRQPAAELDDLCASVRYYPRRTNKTLLFHTFPYIVLSRQSDQLLADLQQDEYPILFEGLHTTWLLNEPALAPRRRVVRMHNIEHDYYRHLALVERNPFKRWYFNAEAEKLKSYEAVLARAHAIAAIAPADAQELSTRYARVDCVPAFHPHDEVAALPGRGDFALYHGNLSIGENNRAAVWLAEEVFANPGLQLVIAGSRPSAELKKIINDKPHIRLVADPDPVTIYRLVREAQVNVLPTFQSTGIKLKLLAALFTGRHCLVNTPMVSGTGLEQLCVIQDDPDEFRNAVAGLLQQDYAATQQELRKSVLDRDFSNRKNAGKLAGMIFMD